jgi:hypothetical protein
MSKTKEFDRLAEKAASQVIEELYNICDWTLSGDEIDELLDSTPLEYNEAHSYLVSLTAAKVAEHLLKNH